VADSQSLEEFDHLHRDALRNLDVEKVHLSAATERFHLGGIDDELKRTLNEIREDLSNSSTGPESVFQRAVAGMSNAERKRFIIENAIEALKSGKSPTEVVNRFTALGLVPPLAPNENVIEEPMRMTQALLERRSIWERVSLSIYQVAVNAVKTVPKWIEIEPHVGFVGPVPTITFGLKTKGMSAYEFLEALRAGIR
jgi:hypothetical protein